MDHQAGRHLATDTRGDVKRVSEILRYLVTVGFADRKDAPHYLELVASDILGTATWTLVGIL